MTDSPPIRIFASYGDSLPRLVTTMTMEEWKAGKDVPRQSPLTWAEVHERCLPEPECPDECPVRKRVAPGAGA